MNDVEVRNLAIQVLEAWNTQDVAKVLECYTDDLIYRDPNTRGDVNGREAMRHYLTKLFANWEMKWFLREGYAIQDENAASILWRATFKKVNTAKIVEINGMDIVVLEGGKIKRNEVYFDRMKLVPLFGILGLLKFFARR